MRKISGPLLDRLDIRVEMPRVAPRDLVGPATSESTAVVACRIRVARERALARNGRRPNANLTGAAAARACALGRAEERVVADLATRGGMTARGVYRVLRVARTLADLDGRERVGDADLLAAAGLRDPAGLPAMAA